MDALTPERWRRVRVLFEQAVDLTDGERHDFLREACEDAELRADVEAMLKADAADFGLLSGPVHRAAPGLISEMGAVIEAEDATAKIGAHIGPYRILEVVGRGGMSVIYLADRADGQFEQRVALKLIKRGMDSDAIVQRFLRERQILARLEHPGIARLYDGGVTASGQPFFAMEYVAGIPITAHADRQRLGIDARLRLFINVCEAVQYAHRNLVVHRDLKPSNVLVTDVDGSPHVKLLDFGIAKLLDDDPEADLLTQTGLRVLTPAYAAPEQLAGEPITTLTDVYALGALLYELLTGRRASAMADVDAATVARPSTVVRASVPNAEGGVQRPDAIADARGLTEERLQRRLAGDLDTICLKALRREPERRYASAEALAEDVRRHLARLPVRARPESLVYLARTFVARHRMGVAAAVVAVLSLVSGLTIAIWQADLARQERDQKQLEALRATATLDYILDVFSEVDPLEAQGRQFSARDLIAPGLRRLDYLRGQPLEYAAVAERLGQLSGALGQFLVADTLLARAQAIHEDLFQPNSPEMATILERRAQVMQAQARFAGADTLLERALAIRRLSPSTDPTPLIQTLNQLGHVRLGRGDLDGAEAAYTEALHLQAGSGGTEPTERPRSKRGLAEVYSRTANLDRAIPLLEEALAEYVRLAGTSHTETARARFSLAQAYQQLEDYHRADSLFQVALETYRHVYGADNQRVGAVLANLGNVWRDAGDEQQALRYYEQAVATYDRAFDGPLLDKALALEKIGTILTTRGQLEQAEPVLRRAYAMVQSLADEDPFHVHRVRFVLARCLFRLGRFTESYGLLRETHDSGIGASADADETARELRLQTLRGLSHVARQLGRADEAVEYERKLE